MKYIYLLLTIIAGLFTNSCKKEIPHTHYDIRIEPNIIFERGDTVRITGTITSDLTIYGYKLSVINATLNNTLVFSKRNDTESKNYVINEYWVNNVPVDSEMRLEIEQFNKRGKLAGTTFHSFHCNN